jgi:hypothetical protein
MVRAFGNAVKPKLTEIRYELGGQFMEPPLTQQPANSEDMLAHARYYARDAQAQTKDVAVMAFPSGHASPSDQMLSAVGTKLRNIISGIENNILCTKFGANNSSPAIWNMLLESGFLKEPALVDFSLARFSEEHLSTAILANGDVDAASQLPAQLLTSGDDILAESAQAMLAGQSLLRRSPGLLYREMPSELLHQTVWRVVAALQIVSGAKNQSHIDAAKSLLASHDESQSLQGAARKIVHFTASVNAHVLLDPEQAGAQIFTAALSAKTGLDQDHIIRLIDGHSSLPLAILLRAVNLERTKAMAVICLFRGFNLTPFEINSFDQNYDLLEQSEVAEIVAEWAIERSSYIAFPSMEHRSQGSKST